MTVHDEMTDEAVQAGVAGLNVVSPIKLSIINILQSRSAHDGQAIAYRFLPDGVDSVFDAGVQIWTWRDLHDRARSVAGDLSTIAHVGRGDRVLLVFSAGLEFVAAFMGCLYLGAIPVPVSPPRRREKLSRWEHISKDADICAILVAPRLIDQMSGLAMELGEVPCLSSDAADPGQSYAAYDWLNPAEVDAQSLAFLQYTSGSTNAPKGVMLTYGNLMTNLAQLSAIFAIGPGDTMASWLPHYHDMGLIGSLLFPLYAGFSVSYISPAAFLRSPMRFLRMVTDLRATGFGAPNFGYEHFVRHASSPAALEGIDLSALTFAFSGAEVIRPDTMEAFTRTFKEVGFRHEMLMFCYGMAETVLFVSGNEVSEAPEYFLVDRAALRSGDVVADKTGLPLANCGRASPGMSIAIVDEAKGVLPEEKIGEIWLRGANVATGYWRNAAASRVSFNQTLPQTVGQADSQHRASGQAVSGWLRTGDLGFLKNERLYITGRLKEAIIVRGQNHAPQDIEASVVSMDARFGSGRIAAFAFEFAGQERVGLALEPLRETRGQVIAESAEIFAAIRSCVSETHGIQVAQISLLKPGTMPITPSGKIQRFACRDGLADASLAPTAQWTETQGQLSDAASGAWHARLQATAGLQRGAVLAEVLRAELAGLAGLAAPEEISKQQRFFELGLDSVAGVTFVSTIERQLGLPLDPTLIYEFPTLDALVPALLDRIFPAKALPVSTVRPAGSEPTLAHELVDEMAALQALLDS